MCGVLTSLAAEQKCDGPLAAFMLGRNNGRLLGLTQVPNRLGAIPRHDHPAMPKALAPDLQRPCDICKGGAITRFETIGEIGGRLLERGRRLGRQNEQDVFSRGNGRIGRWRLLNHNMRVRPADPERTDAGAARRRAGPGTTLRARREWALPQLELRIRRFEIRQRRDFAMIESKYRLDQASHSRRGVEMS